MLVVRELARCINEWPILTAQTDVEFAAKKISKPELVSAIDLQSEQQFSPFPQIMKLYGYVRIELQSCPPYLAQVTFVATLNSGIE